MNEVKVFRVLGEINKPNLKTPFQKEVIAIKSEHAEEKVYSELGSRHRVKRFHIRIIKVEEVPIDNVSDPLLKKLFSGEEEGVKQS